MSKAAVALSFSLMVIPSPISPAYHRCLPLSTLLPHTVTPAAAVSGCCGGYALAAVRRPETVRGHQQRCRARRRIRQEEEEEEEDGEEYGQSSELSLMEAYSERVRSVALLVRATVDGEEEIVLVFKGFSSRLSSRTSSDPWKSVLPARAVIESIDVVRGPFDPSDIDYLEKDLTWEAFRATRLNTKSTTD